MTFETYTHAVLIVWHIKPRMDGADFHKLLAREISDKLNLPSMLLERKDFDISGYLKEFNYPPGTPLSSVLPHMLVRSNTIILLKEPVLPMYIERIQEWLSKSDWIVSFKIQNLMTIPDAVEFDKKMWAERKAASDELERLEREAEREAERGGERRI